MSANNERGQDIENDASGADKRARRSVLKRKYRDRLRESYCELRDRIPYFQGYKGRPSRVLILKKAVEYIRHIQQERRRKKAAHQQDIDELGANEAIEDQIHTGERAERTGNYAASKAVVEHNKENAVAGFDEDSDCDDSSDYDSSFDCDDSSDYYSSDSDESEDSPRNRG